MEQLRPILMVLGLGLAYTLLFFLQPEIDLQLARHLYNPTNGFFLGHERFVLFFYNSIKWIIRSIVVGSIAALAWHGVKSRQLYRPALFILLSLIIGPGLLVHAVFKDNWGRARPSQIVEFGGSKKFTPPFVMSDQCDKNCSFVSGHAAAAFFLAAFGLLFSDWKRTAIYSFGILFGLWIGFIRMAMGGHFFSDIIFAGIFSLFAVHCVYYFVYREPT